MRICLCRNTDLVADIYVFPSADYRILIRSIPKVHLNGRAGPYV